MPMIFERYDGGKPLPPRPADVRPEDDIKREIRFDSSPKYSICRQFGFQENTYRQELDRQEGNKVRYRIYASADKDCPPERAMLVGILTGETRESVSA